MKERIQAEINDSAAVKMRLADEKADVIAEIAKMMIAALRSGRKVLFCGNGGSAADAQHLSAELLGKFKMDRRPLPSMALNVNVSVITAIANDYEFNRVFERQVEGLGVEEDVLVGISTSGRSKNIVRAMRKARSMGLKTVAFVGMTPGPVGDSADICLCVPSDDTPRVQEAHIAVGHIICGLIESSLFGQAGAD